MPRAELTVEDLGPFDLPTNAPLDGVFTSGDGAMWREDPGRPATVMLTATSDNRTFTVTGNPNAPGGETPTWSVTLDQYQVLVLPPGFFPTALFRRGDELETDPGMIYIDSSSSGSLIRVARGPSSFVGKVGAAGGGPAITGGRAKAVVDVYQPLEVPTAKSQAMDPDGMAFFTRNRHEAMGFYHPSSGAQDLRFTVGANKFNQAPGDTEIAITNFRSVLIPPGVLHPELYSRDGESENPGALYFDADANHANIQYHISALSLPRPGR